MKEKAKILCNCCRKFWDTLLMILDETIPLSVMVIISFLPGLGLFISISVTIVLNAFLCMIEPVARFFCSSCYLEGGAGFEKLWYATIFDMMKIWIAFILILTILSLISECSNKVTKVLWQFLTEVKKVYSELRTVVVFACFSIIGGFLLPNIFLAPLNWILSPIPPLAKFYCSCVYLPEYADLGKVYTETIADLARLWMTYVFVKSSIRFFRKRKIKQRIHLV